MASPLVSVIIATQNRRNSLGRAACSVLSQEIPDLELVIVDDASTDDTPGLLDRVAQDRRVRVVRNPEPLGACESRNKGLEVAQGDLVAFCDDDDVWLQGAARSLVAHLEERPDVGAVSSWHLVLHEPAGHVAVFRGPLEFDAHQLLWQNFAIIFGMFRRSSISEELRFDSKLVTGEDWDLWLRAAQEKPVSVIPRALYVYRRHSRDQATFDITRQIQGRRAFLTKHCSAMSYRCRLYHETVIAGYESGRAAMGKHIVSAMRASPRDAAFVAGALAGGFCASRVGTRLGDPGLQARVMASLIRRGTSSGIWNDDSKGVA